MTDNLSPLSQQYIPNKNTLITIITLSPEKDKSCSHSYKYSTMQQTAAEHGQSSYSCSSEDAGQKETGETSGRTTFRTWPKNPKKPQQPLDPGRESLRKYIKSSICWTWTFQCQRHKVLPEWWEENVSMSQLHSPEFHSNVACSLHNPEMCR